MPQPEILIDQSGPLPIEKEFTEGSVGPATLIVSGTVWASQANQLIGIEVFLNGQQVGVAQVYSNGANTHRNVVPKHFGIELTQPWPSPEQPPTYTIGLKPMNSSTVSDHNDYYQVSLIA